MECKYPEILRAVQLRYQAARLDPERSLVILASTENYPPLVDAYYSAAVALGADPILVTYKSRPPMSELPDMILDIACRADQLVDLCYKTYVYSDSWDKVHALLPQRGGRIIDSHMHGGEGDINYLLNCPPDSEMTSRVEKAKRMIDQAQEIRITSSLGTDLTVVRGDRPSATHFPAGQVAFGPPAGCVDGVVFFVGGLLIQFPAHYARMVYQPVRIEVANGKLVVVNRDTEVGIMLDDWFRAQNDPNAYQFSHINLGFDHRVVLQDLDSISCHFNYGGVLIAFGAYFGPQFKAKNHIDLALVGADYSIDGRPILVGGDFTAESGLRRPARG